MIFDVYNYLLKENNITDSLNKTAEATKKSVSTVKRIVKESKSSEFIVTFRTPGSEKSLRRIIKELRFKWKATENNRKVLIETSAIRLLRINYLEKLRQYQQQNRPIVYTDESYVHATHTTPKGWTDGSSKGIKKPLSKGQRVVIVHAGSETGFVPNALLTFKSGMKSGDYHDDMNFQNYEKWIRTQLIPNLPPNSIIVADNASYRNKEYDLAPNANSRKADMQAWLSAKGITFTSEMLKPQVYQLIKNNKDRFKTFSIDKIFKEHGHDVLRLPPYHPNLNPIEMAWAAIKGYVSSKDVRWNVPRVIELVERKDSDSSDSELDSSTDIEDEIVTPGPSSGIPLGNHIEGVMPMSESD
ncbi:unnamed protein product [Parnassius mnemosyne]|uniref:Tc1-like transposase DDE domain-containing protein n=1 Tax=Parnassius mnemosyne TaxID=213953 RepID=A0AAV1KNV4_9NEOP